jgi:hypothetical protein
MTASSERDVSWDGKTAADLIAGNAGNVICYATLDDVQANLGRIGYDGPITYVVDHVERTVPD